MIEEGKHKAIVDSLEFGYTDGGTEQVAIVFRLNDENDPDYGEYITAYRFFTEKAEEYAFKDLQNLNWKGESLQSAPEDCPGAEATIVVEHEVYDGKERAKVKYINTGSGGLKNVFEGKERSDFFARMDRRFKTIAGPKKNVEPEQKFKKKSKKPAPAKDEDDEIPY